MSDTKPLSEYSELEENEIVTNECRYRIGAQHPFSVKVPPFVVGTRWCPGYLGADSVLGPINRTKIIAGLGSEVTLKPSESVANRWFEPTIAPGGFALADALMALEGPAPEVAPPSQWANEKATEALKQKLASCTSIGMMKEMILNHEIEKVFDGLIEKVNALILNGPEDVEGAKSPTQKIQVTFGKIGPDILDEGCGSVRVTLNTKNGMERFCCFPKQAKALHAALGVWIHQLQINEKKESA